MRPFQPNQKPNFRSGWSNALFLLVLMGAVLLLVPSRIEAQIQWTKDPLNPVLSGGASDTWNRHVFSPSVLFNEDSARYEMWFDASAGDPSWVPYRIGFAVSNDGINWTMLDTAVLSPDPGTWDEYLVDGPTIIRENGQYKMWYTGLNSWPSGGIGYATSSDGIQWTKDTLNNPVLEPGTASWEAGGSGYCTIMPVQGGYKMWYTGWDNGWNSSQIGYATSVDGITWEKDPLNNPVLTPGVTGHWDDINMIDPKVLLIDGTYYMWYTGWDNPWTSAVHLSKIGLATSTDGIQWTKYNDTTTTITLNADSDPVLTPSPGQWDGNHVERCTVMLIGDTLHMWYAGDRDPISTYLSRIGHATSPFVPLFAIKDYDNTHIPEEYLLSQNYPNPFNPSTTIRFELPGAVQVNLGVYDLLGREVARLVDDRLRAGNHQVNWNGKAANRRDVPTGIYIARLVTPEYTKSIKMVLLK